LCVQWTSHNNRTWLLVGRPTERTLPGGDAITEFAYKDKLNKVALNLDEVVQLIGMVCAGRCVV